MSCRISWTGSIKLNRYNPTREQFLEGELRAYEIEQLAASLLSQGALENRMDRLLARWQPSSHEELADLFRNMSATDWNSLEAALASPTRALRGGDEASRRILRDSPFASLFRCPRKRPRIDVGHARCPVHPGTARTMSRVTRRNIIYLMSLSLDGFVEGPDGKFAWSEPDEEVHRFYNRMAGELGAFLYGRRMYEMMSGWQSVEESAVPDYIAEFARIWKGKPKIVFSTTLETVVENCRLVRGDIAAEVERLKQEPGGDLGVSGPGLASALARLSLIDEYRLVLHPVLVGGGKPYFPALEQEIRLRLQETRAFRCGAVYLRYRRA